MIKKLDNFFEICNGILTVFAVCLTIFYLMFYFTINLSNYIMRHFPPPHYEQIYDPAVGGSPV